MRNNRRGVDAGRREQPRGREAASRSRAAAPLAATLALAFALAACGAGDAPRVAVERTDSAGVQIVRSIGDDVPLDWTFTPTLTLGGADEGPASFYQLSRSNIAVGPAGNLYVLDRSSHRVVVFDTAGRHLRTLGREGGGPGELQRFPSGLAVAPDGVVSVHDAGKRGLVRFAADGSVLPTRRLGLPFFFGSMAVSDSLLLLAVDAFPREGDLQYEHFVALAPSGDTTVIASIGQPKPDMIDFGCVGLRLPPLFAPSLSWAARGRRAALNTDAAYVIDVYRDGRLVESYRRDVEPRPVTDAMARREIGEDMTVRFGGGGECTIPVDDVIEKRGYADVLPTIASLVAAPDGTIWVERTVVGDAEPAIDLISAEGEYLGTLPSGSPLPAAFLPDGRPIAIETDEFDVQRLVVYAVDRTGGAADAR